MNVYEQVKGKPHGTERNINKPWERNSFDEHKGYITGCAVMDCGRVEEGEWLSRLKARRNK